LGRETRDITLAQWLSLAPLFHLAPPPRHLRRRTILATGAPHPASPSSPPSEQVDYSFSPSPISIPAGDGGREPGHSPADKPRRTFKEVLLSTLQEDEDGKAQAPRPEDCGLNGKVRMLSPTAHPGSAGHPRAPPQMEMKTRLKSIVVAPNGGKLQSPPPAGDRPPIPSRLTFPARARAPSAGGGFPPRCSSMSTGWSISAHLLPRPSPREETGLPRTATTGSRGCGMETRAPFRSASCSGIHGSSVDSMTRLWAMVAPPAIRTQLPPLPVRTGVVRLVAVLDLALRREAAATLAAAPATAVVAVTMVDTTGRAGDPLQGSACPARKATRRRSCSRQRCACCCYCYT
jgi:hypothetical protein